MKLFVLLTIKIALCHRDSKQPFSILFSNNILTSHQGFFFNPNFAMVNEKASHESFPELVKREQRVKLNLTCGERIKNLNISAKSLQRSTAEEGGGVYLSREPFLAYRVGHVMSCGNTANS